MNRDDPDLLLHTAEHHFFSHNDAQAHQALTQLLTRQRKHPRANELMALLLVRLAQPAQALPYLDIACNAATCSGDALYQYGVLLFQSGKADKAIKILKKAVARQPDHFPAQHDLGLALAQSGRHQDALAAFLRAATLNEQSAELHFNIAHLQELLSQPDAALAAYARAVQIEPSFTAAWSNRADLLAAQGQRDEALEHYDRALAIDPRRPDTLSNKGNLLGHLRRFDEAIAHYQKALSCAPGHFVARTNLGMTYLRLNLLDAAERSFDQALDLNPIYGRALTGKGVVLHDRQAFTEAALIFDRAIALDKNDAEARWSKARTQLITGDYAQGWINHESRWCKNPQPLRAYKGIPRLTALKQAPGKRVLVWCEQGYGDTLQFCRYIPLMTALAAKVTFAVPGGLVRLLDGQFEARVISQSAPPASAEYDFQVPLLSLPLLFASNEGNLPNSTPYLRADSALRDQWSHRLDLATDRPNIAIAFSGNPEQSEDLRRSMPLAALLPLLPLGRLHIVQKDLRPTDQAILTSQPEIRDHSGQIKDFADTAAILSLMDRVVSVDSAPAHLAGALGLPLQVLLAFTPDWRWLIGRPDSPWYPTAKLYRQPAAGDWHTVVEQLNAPQGNAQRAC